MTRIKSVNTFIWVFFGFVQLANSQVPSASFLSSPTSCLNQNIDLQNSSTAATQYAWDFCLADLKVSPVAQLQATLPNTGTFYYHSIRVVQDAGQWIAFVTDLNGNKLIRLDYGTSLSNTPNISNLGTFSGLSTPGGLELIKYNGTWYAFILNLFGNSCVRLQFSNGLNQPPTLADNLGNISGALSVPSAVKMVFTNGKYLAIVVNFANNSILLLDFGSSPANTPILLNTVNSALFDGIYGISLQQVGGNWYAVTGSLTASKAYLLSYGTDLASSPSVTEIDGIPSGSDLELATESQQQYAIVRSRTDGLYRIDFGVSYSSTPIVTRLGLLGVLNNESRGIAIVRDSPRWSAFTVDATGNVSKIDFEGNCSSQVSINNSTAQNPGGLFYKSSGTYTIELTAINGQGISVASSDVVVANQTSSGVSIQKSIEQCSSVNIIFQASSAGTLASYNWDFGDGSSTSTTSVVSHSYSTSGQFTISLDATEQNGCKNKATKTFNIYDAPMLNFSLPSTGGPICTNQLYTFTNLTTVATGAPVTWQWRVDNVLVSTNIDLNQSFSTASTYSIELSSSIPGCSASLSKNFVVSGVGSPVDFNFSGQCVASITQFSSITSGSIVGFSWDFGDNQASSATNPSHQYSSKGIYNVSLQVLNNTGCANNIIKSVSISDTPLTDLFIDLPPFSCSGTPTQFHDATPAPAGSNITSWLWAFNDGTGATSRLQNPTHTFAQSGNYTIDFTASTNFGCSASVQKNVFISPNPSTDFTFGPACLNKPTQFTSSNSQSVNSWQWTIGNSSYTFANPIHTFTSSGNYNAALTVQASNGCESQTTKTITVKPAPVLNFTPTSICEDAPTDFTDATTGADFPISWLWDFGNNNTISSNPASFTFNNAGAFPVSLSVTTVSGCAYSISKNVVVAPAPVASFTAAPSVGPPPLNVQFTNTSTNSNSVLWEFGDAASSTSNNANSSFTYTSLGDYLVQLTAASSNGCTNSYNQTIHVIIPSTDLQLLGMSVQQNTTDGSLTPILTVKNNGNLTVTHFDVELSGSSGSRVKPTVSSTLLPSEIAEVVVPIQLLTNEKFLCADLSIAEDKDLSNNSWCEDLIDSRIIVQPYPNPASGNIYFEVVLQNSDVGTLSVFSGQGKQVFKQDFQNLSTGMNRIELDLSNYQPGLYLGVWDFQGHRKSFRFLVN